MLLGKSVFRSSTFKSRHFPRRGLAWFRFKPSAAHFPHGDSVREDSERSMTEGSDGFRFRSRMQDMFRSVGVEQGMSGLERSSRILAARTTGSTALAGTRTCFGFRLSNLRSRVTDAQEMRPLHFDTDECFGRCCSSRISRSWSRWQNRLLGRAREALGASFGSERASDRCVGPGLPLVWESCVSILGAFRHPDTPRPCSCTLMPAVSTALGAQRAAA